MINLQPSFAGKIKKKYMVLFAPRKMQKHFFVWLFVVFPL